MYTQLQDQSAYINSIKLNLILVMLFCCKNSFSASFDCSKTHTNVEELVCKDPISSNADDQLAKLYSDVYSRANDIQRSQLKADQIHWIKKTRGLCKDEDCIKISYWSRIAELLTYFDPKSRTSKNENMKKAAVQSLLSSSRLTPNEPAPKQCEKLLDNLKAMKNVDFLDPAVSTMTIEDTALDNYKNQAIGAGPFNFEYTCTPNLYTDNLSDALSGMCSVYIGLPPFNLYDLPPLRSGQEHRYFFYADSSIGPMNIDGISPQTVSSGSGFGVQEISLGSKRELTGFAQGGLGVANGTSFNGMINMDKAYYMLILQHPYKGAHQYELNISPVDQHLSCIWSVE